MSYKPYLPPKPVLPTPSKKKTNVAHEICNTTDRVYNWDGWGGNDDDHDEEIESFDKVIDEIGMANRGQVISLSEIIKHLPKHLKIEDVYFTASFCDDHLRLHVRYDEEVNLYEQQMKKYQEDMKTWEDHKKQYEVALLRYEEDLKKELASIRDK